MSYLSIKRVLNAHPKQNDDTKFNKVSCFHLFLWRQYTTIYNTNPT